MQHMDQKHGGQQLLPKSVGQLRRLDRAACVVCGIIRSRRCKRCGLCQSNTPLRGLRVGTDDSPDIKVQRPAVRPPISNLLIARSQCDPLDDSPLQNPHKTFLT